MFNKLSYEDQRQLFLGCLLIWKNKFVFVKSINDRVYRLCDLATQEEVYIQDAYMEMTPPYRRIGMVNANGSCVYVMRAPVKQFQVGYSSHNCKFLGLPVNYPDGVGATRSSVSTLCIKGVYEALTGKYPSLKEAINIAVNSGGACAFDKQFAICSERVIYFRDKKVGILPKNRVGIVSIEWFANQEHLSLLLEKNHEKDLRIVATKL